MDKHDSDINMLVQLPERRRIIMFPKMSLSSPSKDE